MISYLLLFILIIIVALSANLIRFHLHTFLNKLLFSLSALAAVEISVFITGTGHIHWMMITFVCMAAFSFYISGGMVAAFSGALISFVQTQQFSFVHLFIYLLIGILAGYLTKEYLKKRQDNQAWIGFLMTQSKQLHLFREISLSMQQTLNRDKLIQIILTSVTAGHGLGFNRAMIFLISNDGKFLEGNTGIGPMDVDEGYNVWERISANKFKLKDLIEYNHEKQLTDPKLNEIIQTLKIPLDNDHTILSQALTSKKPVIIKNPDENDCAQKLFKDIFSMNEFAVIPLLNQGSKIGVLIIDNLVNKKPITIEDTESVIPLANHAAIAIDHANLYMRIEDMALKDGLTGLYNQRAFQKFFDQLFSYTLIAKKPMSLIMLDIDYFKYFNDKNGHLLGNELLTMLANIMKQSLRENDYSFRFGGEEFVALLPDTPLEDARHVGERIRQNIERAYFPCQENQPGGTITVSIGIASTEHPNIQTKNKLIEAADQALYLAKDAGKNNVFIYKGIHVHE